MLDEPEWLSEKCNVVARDVPRLKIARHRRRRPQFGLADGSKQVLTSAREVSP